MSNTNRRQFIKQSAMYAVAVSISGTFNSCNDKDIPPLIESCQTTSDILGPFFKEGAPIRGDLTFHGQEGLRLNIFGKIMGSNCSGLLQGATIDLWHADNSGAYDDSSNFINRAKLITTADGNYSFKTIMPGKYLNGPSFRPSHLHIKVSAPGHLELVSQIYFKGDPDIANDPWASNSSAELRILETIDNSGVLEVSFDISLEKS